MLFLSGCSAVWLARLTGGQKVASSTLAIPTIFLLSSARKQKMVNEACQGFASCFAAAPQSASCAEGTLHSAKRCFITNYSPRQMKHCSAQQESALLSAGARLWCVSGGIYNRHVIRFLILSGKLAMTMARHLTFSSGVSLR